MKFMLLRRFSLMLGLLAILGLPLYRIPADHGLGARSYRQTAGSGGNERGTIEPGVGTRTTQGGRKWLQI